jgi:hypothetical protein
VAYEVPIHATIYLIIHFSVPMYGTAKYMSIAVSSVLNNEISIVDGYFLNIRTVGRAMERSMRIYCCTKLWCSAISVVIKSHVSNRERFFQGDVYVFLNAIDMALNLQVIRYGCVG